MSHAGNCLNCKKLILVALSEPRCAVMKRRGFNQTIKRLYYGKDSRVATSSLSRAYQRLEDRQYIVRFGGRWKLTDVNARSELTHFRSSKIDPAEHELRD